MRNIKLTIQYDGTRYNGWQNQKSTDNTIQGKLEQLLTRMAGESVTIFGSGRTDAGVHAMGQIANFKSNSSLTCTEMLAYINEYLPADIAVIDVTEVPERFHSRLNAVEKTYTYRIWNSPVPNVFQRHLLHVVPEALNLDAMKQASALLCGTHDFQSFCATKAGKKSTVRTLVSIEYQTIGDELRIHFTGNGFLYHMVRILVGTLLEVGLGSRSPLDIPSLLEQKDRSQAGHLAPAQGLSLVRVRYPEP